MPKVGKGKDAVEFDYTPEGIEQAEQYAEETGLPISNAMERTQNYQWGGRVLPPAPPVMGRVPRRPMPSVAPVAPVSPVGQASPLPRRASLYEKGGKVKKYKNGGKVK